MSSKSTLEGNAKDDVIGNKLDTVFLIDMYSDDSLMLPWITVSDKETELFDIRVFSEAMTCASDTTNVAVTLMSNVELVEILYTCDELTTAVWISCNVELVETLYPCDEYTTPVWISVNVSIDGLTLS